MRRDWVSRYFEALRSLGEDIHILAGRIDLAEGSVQWFERPHSECDGLAFFAELLERDGSPMSRLPRLADPRPPTLRTLLSAMLKLTVDELAPRPPVPWRYYDDTQPYRTFGKLFHAFSRDDTQRLLKAGRAMRTSMNALTLKAINELVNESLLLRPATNRWFIPVNMRGYSDQQDERANNISYFYFSVPPGQPGAAIESAFRREFGYRTYYAPWLFLSLGKRLGFSPAEVLLKAEYRLRRAVTNVGVFSTMGDLDRNLIPGCKDDVAWVGLGNVYRKAPLFAFNSIYDGRLVLSLQMHSTIAASQVDADCLMAAWVQRVAESSSTT